MQLKTLNSSRGEFANEQAVVVLKVVLMLLLSIPALCPAAVSKVSATNRVIITLHSGADVIEIQDALDSLPDAGGEVVLPAGTFEITEPIVLERDSQTLRGAGPATILHLADDANCPVIIMGEAANLPKRIVRHLCVSDLFIDGNRNHQQRELWQLHGEGSEIRNNGITIQGVSDSTVEHVICAHCRSGGLVTTLGVKRLTVRDLNSFDNEFDGLACYLTVESVFTGLYLHDNPGAGISLDLSFDQNVISNAVLVANDLGIFMRSSRDNQFDNVSIRDSHHFGVFMANAIEATSEGCRPAPKTECAENAFTNLIATNCGSAAFRVNDLTCTNNVIINAQFEENPKGGLSLAEPSLIMLR